MSFHILHISEYGCKLSKDRGFLVCSKEKRELGRMAIEDMRSLVIVSESVSYSSAIVASLLENDTAILHCANFKPAGLTIPLNRIYDARTVLNQGARPKILNREIWKALLKAKVCNSAAVLSEIGTASEFLERVAKEGGMIDEARCARAYWAKYFPAIGAYGERRRPEDSDSKPNAMLNYGYGVLGGLIHRSLIVHGLSPLFGVCHKTYYKNAPLVYDVIEPFRSIVDLLLHRYLLADNVPNIASWSKYLGRMLRDYRVRRKGASLKLMDAVEFVSASLANCYRNKDAGELWLPYINLKYGKTNREKKSLQNGLDDGNV